MEQLIIIRHRQELTNLYQYLQDKDFIAIDTETTGVTKEAQIIGVSFCAELDKAYYVVLERWDTTSQKLITGEGLADGLYEIFESLEHKNLVMHNAVFDCSMINTHFNIDLMPAVHTDTMILAHLLNENRPVGLKELAVAIYGEDDRKEQMEMKESVTKNGGQLTKTCYELYKADSELLGRYGAKDTILTLKLFYHLIPELYEQQLNIFFYEEESMPLLKGPTYQLNTTGLRVDPDKLAYLKRQLEADCLEAKAFIYKEIEPHVRDKYPGDKPKNTFNIGSSKQLSWLLYGKLGCEFNALTKAGKDVCKALGMDIPYTPGAKRQFIREITEKNGHTYQEASVNAKTGKMGRPKKVAEPWHYIACGKEALAKYSTRYKWVAKFLEYAKNQKLLTTYVEGIQERQVYNVIRPSFLQHGTTSGRYSSKAPNFQNLPRDDKRVKSCIVARPGNVFVGADYAQLEPRVFASVSQDQTLMRCFAIGEDFYSVVGAPIYGKNDCSMFKNDSDSFAKMFPKLRDQSKVIALATPYGRTAAFMATTLGITMDAAQELIDKYFEEYPSVEKMMLDSHAEAKANGVVYNLYGRPRRIPEAIKIDRIYGKNTRHSKLPYEARTLLNLAMNHRVQSTAASIMNRSAISVGRKIKELALEDQTWHQVKIILQVHDELILEGPEALKQQMISILKECMENTVVLPGVALVAEPKAAYNLADLK